MSYHDEDRNYVSDHRVIAGERGERFAFDPRAMTITVTLYTDDGDEDECELPARFDVCPTCQGKGSHVNPSIDAGGITASDWEEWDDEDREGYFAGRYDVPCFECGGQRVVPAIDESDLSDTAKAAVERFYAQEREAAECDAISRAERAMGA